MDGSRKPPNRINEQGQRQVAPTWESLVERQIREAIDEGKFDDLPHQGERLPLEDDTLAGEWAMAYHVLRNAGGAPPWIEADREVRALLDRRDVLFARMPTVSPTARRRDRAALERLVVEINAAIASLNAGAPTDHQHRRLLSPDDELARYDTLTRR